MVRVWIDCDERYPDYLLTEPSEGRESYGSFVFDVDYETLVRWKNAIAAYEAVQDEMGELYEPRFRGRHE